MYSVIGKIKKDADNRIRISRSVPLHFPAYFADEYKSLPTSKTAPRTTLWIPRKGNPQ
jgi:hypothetical protein